MNKINVLSVVLLLASIVFFSSSFVSNYETSEISKEELVGTWVYKSYKDGFTNYSRSKDFKSNKPGYKFNADGTLVKRMDPDYCMRVKGPYANTNGTWEILEGNVLSISYECYNGSTTSTYIFKDLSKKKFSMKSFKKK